MFGASSAAKPLPRPTAASLTGCSRPPLLRSEALTARGAAWASGFSTAGSVVTRSCRSSMVGDHLTARAIQLISTRITVLTLGLTTILRAVTPMATRAPAAVDLLVKAQLQAGLSQVEAACPVAILRAEWVGSRV